MNAVWLFNTTSMLWTFITGDVNSPSITHNSTYYGGTWMGGCDIDENDRVWIYGGWGNSDNNTDDYGHLWTFDTRVKRQWEFEYGADALAVWPQVVSDDFNADNRPPATEGCSLIDRHDGTLMLAPSYAYTSTGGYGLSDTIWLYSKSLLQWKLVYGDITAHDLQGNYSNYHAPGSALRSSSYPSSNSGKNANGDFYIVGGGQNTYFNFIPNYKDIWLIPQDQCANNIHKCDINADSIEEMVGYSCKCKDGYTGDGFICVGPPVADAPMSSAPSSATPSAAKTPSNKTNSASIVGVTFAAVLGLVIAR